MRLTKVLVLMLLLDAGAVFVMQLLKVNCWAWICLYWGLLTAKNYVDWRRSR